jgi:hypothetical protein
MKVFYSCTVLILCMDVWLGVRCVSLSLVGIFYHVSDLHLHWNRFSKCLWLQEIVQTKITQNLVASDCLAFICLFEKWPISPTLLEKISHVTAQQWSQFLRFWWIDCVFLFVLCIMCEGEFHVHGCAFLINITLWITHQKIFNVQVFDNRITIWYLSWNEKA